MTGDYMQGYVDGYRDGQQGRRAPDQPQRDTYNAGYDCGHEDGTTGEAPDYTRHDLERFRTLEAARLSIFAI